ncbi:MAG: transcriptional regulator, partial [bacterium]|nr:transcriptional regulator [bacterium]
NHNRAGMLIIQQIVEQLLPHVEAGDLEIAESIIIQIQQNSQVVALTDLLQQR